jgi:RNA polymerase primary sigma factor
MTETRPDGAAAVSDSLTQYLREIRRHRLLTPAEEVALAKRIEAGDVAAKNRMVESNLRLVVATARARAYRGVPVLDMIQEGTLGLLRAVEGFDWRRGTKFSTYAVWWIRQAIDRAVCDQAEPIRVPVHVLERRRRLARAESALDSELSRKPTLDELARATDLSRAHAEQALASRHAFTSLDGTDADATSIADPHAADAYERVHHGLTVSPLLRVLARLGPLQRRVIELRFGIDGDECSTERTAELLELSPKQVTMLERDALHCLRELASPAELRTAA